MSKNGNNIEVGIPKHKLKRWPGVLMSLFVPGFGLLRSGDPKRFWTWFIGFQVASFLLALLLIIPTLPNWSVFILVALPIILMGGMLGDSFRPGRVTKKQWWMFGGLCLLLLIAPSPWSLVLKGFRIPSNAMAPTIQGYKRDTYGKPLETSQPDRIMVNRVAFLVSAPKRGEIVAFDTKGITINGAPLMGERYIKRIVGMPGESICIDSGTIYINGKPLTSDDGIPDIEYTYFKSSSGLLTSSEDSFVVPKDSYFMLGDNTKNSLDSRLFGAVPIENLYGKVVRIFYPLDRMGPPVYSPEAADELRQQREAQERLMHSNRQ